MKKRPQKAMNAILKRQSFEPGTPGPLLLNIESLMDALATGVPTNSKYFAFPIRCLADMNERLVTPVAHKMKRPQLKSFPTLAGLFLLLRASGLAVGATKPKRLLHIDPEMREKWDELNSTEQYMSLLETWWTKVAWTMLGESDPFETKLQSDTRNLYYQLSEPLMNAVDWNDHLYSWDHRTAAALLEQFGWTKTAYATAAAEGKVAEIRSIEKTDFGDAMFATLNDVLGGRKRDGSIIQRELQSLFPNWKNSLRPAEQAFREGRYKLRLAWMKVWRRLEAPATTSLEDVTRLLLESFDFEQDHLYQLSYRTASGKEVTVEDPRYHDGKLFADKVRLGELPLKIGDSIGLLFDFGDCWRFTITIESVDESATDDFAPVITASEGEAPKQYDLDDDDDYYDDDDEDEDEDGT
ncbi:Plasmid pRiA4b ORF-3-like protein [Rubripirellula lacrimiformis]|uniref:Plasmid pRiA4b ORF-3-like protein n=1 Tax=Rubripirellula lacrimiformis TaxID=1930273 RepID=A0A517NKA4_9BACT|nr:plasmid pRiA4b ORF-3 family protein [Rubripirellula lacrimiformis]QDT07574.1 Plasmid pRiA4b ORF-3-like protein [Rubripirellula lacrimiformis]